MLMASSSTKPHLHCVLPKYATALTNIPHFTSIDYRKLQSVRRRHRHWHHGEYMIDYSLDGGRGGGGKLIQLKRSRSTAIAVPVRVICGIGGSRIGRLLKKGWTRRSTAEGKGLVVGEKGESVSMVVVPERLKVVGLVACIMCLCNADRVVMSVAIVPLAAKYGWSNSFLGIVQSSFLWGYIFSSVIGGALVDKYGGKLVIAWGGALWSLATLLTPWAANHSTASLLAVRAFFGLAEGVAMPSMNTLLSRWFPVHERATAVGISMGGFHIGNVVGLVLTPLMMSSAGFSGPFFLFASFGALWLTTWLLRVTNDPQHSNYIKKAELRLIQVGKSDSPTIKGKFPPLGLLLSKLPTWAIIFANATNNWGYFVLLSWMPVYFKTVFGVNLKQAAWFSAVPWGTMAISGYIAGATSDYFIRAGYSLTLVRKIMQLIGFIGPGVSLICLNYAKTPEAAAVLLTIALSLSSFSQAGFLLNMQDIAPQYAGFLHGISNSVGTVAAIVSTIGTGFFVQWLGSFQAFLNLTAFLYFVTAIFWCLCSTGEKGYFHHFATFVDGLKEDGEKNLLVSPMSYNIILNMIAGAASGATLKEILEFLQCDEIKEVNSNSSNMMRSISTGEENNGNGAVIQILNGIWFDQHYRLKPSYEELAQQIYKAYVKNIDFLNKADEVVKDANEWAKAATKGLVTEILHKSDLDDVTFVLGNAIHFKGTWMEVFDPCLTENKHFYLLNGRKKPVPFMTGCENFYHRDYASFELVKIPYRKGENGNDFSMYIFLPIERDGLESLLHETASDGGFFHKEYTFPGMWESNICPFWVPKFKFSYFTSKAKKTMQEMGLKSPFDRVSSELKEMVDEQLFVSKIFQKCYIEVDELGTQAVAITSLDDECDDEDDDPPPRMFIADHPFMFMIREEKSKVVLFTGVVLDPSLTA